MQHGTPNTYSYHKCRCEKCKQANNMKAKEFRARNMANGYKCEAWGSPADKSLVEWMPCKHCGIKHAGCNK